MAVKFNSTAIPAQKAFMESIKKELLYSGAYGAGKSRVGCEKGNFLSLKYPKNRGLIIRKEFTALRDTTMKTFFDEVVIPEHIQDYHKQERRLVYKNGSEILFLGMESTTKIGSLGRAWIFADEIVEFSLDDYLMLLGRLRTPHIPFRQIFGATNPGDPQHWIYKRFFEDQSLIDAGQIEVAQSPTADNPFVPDDYKESLGHYKGRYKERYVEGKWVSFEGLVYDNFDVSKHRLPRTTKKLGLTGDPDNPIPDDWDRFRSIDFGFTNPFVCQWWASPRYRYVGPVGKQDRQIIPFNERVFVRYKEIYYSGRTVDDHAVDILNNSRGETIRATIADHDAGDRAILEQRGISSIPAKKDVQSGIESLYSAIGADRIYFLEDSLIEVDVTLEAENKPIKTEDEFSGYNRAKGREGKFDPKEKPAKLNDHGMDAARYLYHTLKLAYSGTGGAYGNTEAQQARSAKLRDQPETRRKLVSTRHYVGTSRNYASTGRRNWR